jgi:acetolactate synthase small subunit
LIVELTSTPDKIKTFEESIKPFGILDSARTGVTAL